MEPENDATEPLTPDPGLSRRVIRGGMWVFSLGITGQVFRLARTIVLARVLVPDDFGLIGFALLAMSVLAIFSKIGFDIALIQGKDGTDLYLDTAWTAQVARGIVVSGVLFAAAPLVSMFFDAPEVVPIVRVIALAELFRGFTSIGIIYFRKELEFGKQFLYEFSGIVADLAVAIPAALILRSVWALVFGLLAGQFVQFIMSYVIHPYRPRLKIDLRELGQLFRFGKWILSSSILAFLLTQGDAILVGRILGATALGFYQMAYRLSNLPATQITQVISQVSFPAYSKLQDNAERLRKAYLEVLQLTFFISIPLATVIFILAPNFTALFLGEKWIPMVGAMKILVFWGALRSITASAGALLTGVGRPDITAKLQFTRLLVFATLVYPFTVRWGIIGTALVVCGVALLFTPFYMYFSGKLVGCPRYAFFRVIGAPTIGAIVMLLGASLAGVFLSAEQRFLNFLVLLVTSFLTYMATMLVLDRTTGYGFREVIYRRFIGR